MNENRTPWNTSQDREEHLQTVRMPGDTFGDILEKKG